MSDSDVAYVVFDTKFSLRRVYLSSLGSILVWPHFVFCIFYVLLKSTGETCEARERFSRPIRQTTVFQKNCVAAIA